MRLAYIKEASQLWLFTIYDKDELADLSAAEKLALRRALAVELAARRPRP